MEKEKKKPYVRKGVQWEGFDRTDTARGGKIGPTR